MLLEANLQLVFLTSAQAFPAIRRVANATAKLLNLKFGHITPLYERVVTLSPYDPSPAVTLIEKAITSFI
jgi:hypothetical protein